MAGCRLWSHLKEPVAFRASENGTQCSLESNLVPGRVVVTELTKLKTTGRGLEWGSHQLIFGHIHLRGLTDCDTDVS